MYRRNALNPVTPARHDRDDEKRMLPCRYFMAGFCNKGTRCKFYHPNMHMREPCIRVPDLPNNFSRIPQYGRENRDYGLSSYPETSKFGGSSTPPRNKSEEFSPKFMLSPSSHAYSEYKLTQRPRIGADVDSKIEKRTNSPTNSIPDVDKPQQNTVFDHIDWSEFLAPGISPPPPTLVPEQVLANQ